MAAPADGPEQLLLQPLLGEPPSGVCELMLDGEGGDELFGAARGLIADRLARGRLLAALRLTARSVRGGRQPAVAPAREAVPHPRRPGRAAARPPPRGSKEAAGVRRFAPSWFRPESARLLFESDDPWAWKRLSGPRWWAQLADSLTSGVAARGPRPRARRRAEMAGLEARHPFLDAELIDFVLRLPPELGFDPHRSRPLLRAAMAGVVPDEVRCGTRQDLLRRCRSTRRWPATTARWYAAWCSTATRSWAPSSISNACAASCSTWPRGASPGPPLLDRELLAARDGRVLAALGGRSRFAERALASWNLREPRYELGEAAQAPPVLP